MSINRLSNANSFAQGPGDCVTSRIDTSAIFPPPQPCSCLDDVTNDKCYVCNIVFSCGCCAVSHVFKGENDCGLWNWICTFAYKLCVLCQRTVQNQTARCISLKSSYIITWLPNFLCLACLPGADQWMLRHSFSRVILGEYGVITLQFYRADSSSHLCR